MNVELEMIYLFSRLNFDEAERQLKPGIFERVDGLKWYETPKNGLIYVIDGKGSIHRLNSRQYLEITAEQQEIMDKLKKRNLCIDLDFFISKLLAIRDEKLRQYAKYFDEFFQNYLRNSIILVM